MPGIDCCTSADSLSKVNNYVLLKQLSVARSNVERRCKVEIRIHRHALVNIKQNCEIIKIAYCYGIVN